MLAEKKMNFVSHEIDILSGGQHDPSYVRLNPNHVVPTLVHDGAVLIVSTLINEYLDEAFPAIPLRPAHPLQRHRLRMWTKLLDEHVHAATAAVTFAIGPRVMILQKPADEREAEIEAIPISRRGLPGAASSMGHRPEILLAFLMLAGTINGPGTVDPGLKQLVAYVAHSSSRPIRSSRLPNGRRCGWRATRR